jgi:hypothetical protein
MSSRKVLTMSHNLSIPIPSLIKTSFINEPQTSSVRVSIENGVLNCHHVSSHERIDVVGGGVITDGRNLRDFRVKFCQFRKSVFKPEDFFDKGSEWIFTKIFTQIRENFRNFRP